MPPDKHKAGSSRDDQPGEVPQEMLKDNKKKRPNKAQQTPGSAKKRVKAPQQAAAEARELLEEAMQGPSPKAASSLDSFIKQADRWHRLRVLHAGPIADLFKQVMLHYLVPTAAKPPKQQKQQQQQQAGMAQHTAAAAATAGTPGQHQQGQPAPDAAVKKKCFQLVLQLLLLEAEQDGFVDRNEWLFEGNIATSCVRRYMGLASSSDEGQAMSKLLMVMCRHSTPAMKQVLAVVHERLQKRHGSALGHQSEITKLLVLATGAVKEHGFEGVPKLVRKVVRALAPLLWKDATYMDALQAFLDIVVVLEGAVTDLFSVGVDMWCDAGGSLKQPYRFRIHFVLDVLSRGKAIPGDACLSKFVKYASFCLAPDAGDKVHKAAMKLLNKAAWMLQSCSQVDSYILLLKLHKLRDDPNCNQRQRERVQRAVPTIHQAEFDEMLNQERLDELQTMSDKVQKQLRRQLAQRMQARP